MFAIDSGESTWHELNIISPGAHYGWPDVEGTANSSQFADPVQQWPIDKIDPTDAASIGGILFVSSATGDSIHAISVTHPNLSESFISQLGPVSSLTTRGNNLVALSRQTAHAGTHTEGASAPKHQKKDAATNRESSVTRNSSDGLYEFSITEPSLLQGE